MHDDLLRTYLNDHLAGAVNGIETLRHCRDHHADGPVAAFLTEMLAEIEEDRSSLEDVIARVGGTQSVTKKATAWLSEKFSRLKTAGGTSAGTAFARMEQLELLVVGVTGKLALWEALESVLGSDPRFESVDWPELKRRAEDQRRRINEARIEAAREAFAASG